MKVLYIADFLYFMDGGAHVSACAHKDTLIDMYGAENVDIISLTGQGDDRPQYNEIDIIRGERNKIRLWIDCFLGYTTYLNKNGIKRILSYIHKNNYSIVLIDNSIFGLLVKQIKENYPKLPVISYYHDVKASLALKWKKEASLRKKVVYEAMIYSENINQQFCDVNLTLNPRESALYEKYYGKKPELQLGVYMDIQLDPDYLNSDQELSDVLNILFIGSHYKPNVDGIDWFMKKVLPLVSVKNRLIVAGSQMDLLQNELTSIPENVHIMGHVEDLSKLYMEADIVISPIFEGGGMKVKIAHAVGYGKVIIGTDESFEGYQENIEAEQWNKFFYRCNTEKEFACAIESIREDSTLHKMNKPIREYFERNYSKEYAKQVLEKAIDMARNIVKNKTEGLV